jgi:hypothetical protein
VSPTQRFPRGHTALEARLNYRKELRRLRNDPVAPLIGVFGGDRRFARIFQDTSSRYEETFDCYFLSLKRFFPEQSLAGRWRRGPYFKLKYGERYTLAEKGLAQRFNAIAPFLNLDFYNCLLWGRMLLDRMAALSRYFLSGRTLPSFHSFADHKKFFVKQTAPFGDHEAYARYIRERTDWFDLPLKGIRDTYVVHSSPPHMRVFGHAFPSDELHLIIRPAARDGSAEPPVVTSVTRMAQEIHEFQSWFAAYGLKAIRGRRRKIPSATREQ